MAVLRQSLNVTNILDDSLRFHDLSDNLMWLTNKGLVTNADPAVSSDLILTGFLNASAAYVNTLEATNGSITTLDVSAARIHSLDASTTSVGSLVASAACIQSMDVSSQTVSTLDVSEARIHFLDVSDERVASLEVTAARSHQVDVSSATITDVSAITTRLHTMTALKGFIRDITASAVTLQGTPGAGTLTYSASNGLLVNSSPLYRPTPQPFSLVTEYNFQPYINSFNQFLKIVDGVLVTIPVENISGFAVSVVYSTSVTLQWVSLGPDYSYTITIPGLGQRNFPEDGVPKYNTIYGTILGLNPNTTYFATITGTNNGVFISAPSSITFLTLPSQVINIVVTVTQISATITWDPVPGADSYIISLNPAVVPPQTQPGTTYIVNGLTPDTNYTVSITSVIGGIAGTPSTNNFTTLTIPTVSNFGVDQITDSAARLTWTSVGPEYAYRITYTGFTYTTAQGATLYQLTGLASNTSYSVSIVALLVGYSGPASTVGFTTVGGYTQSTINQAQYYTYGIPPGLPPNPFVPAGRYFDPTAFGFPLIASRPISITDGFVVPYQDPGPYYTIYQSVFYLSPPIDLLKMVLWIACDDGVALRITDPDTNIVTDLINNSETWRGGVGPQGGGAYRFPAAGTTGIILNLYAGKYYKIECNSQNNTGAASCSLLYTIPEESSPGTPVTYTVNFENAMALMTGATVPTTIPSNMGTGPANPTPPPQLFPRTWFYI